MGEEGIPQSSRTERRPGSERYWQQSARLTSWSISEVKWKEAAGSRPDDIKRQSRGPNRGLPSVAQYSVADAPATRAIGAKSVAIVHAVFFSEPNLFRKRT